MSQNVRNWRRVPTAFEKRSSLVSVFSLSRWFRFLVSRSTLGFLAVAVVLCLRLVVRVRHKATTLLN